MNRVIVDTGPLVAYLLSGEHHHAWAVGRFSKLPPPFLTCEAVLSEACFLLARDGGSPDALLELVERGLIRVSFQLTDEMVGIRQLMRKYSDVPMSFADACLVRMTEQLTDCVVVTLDSHFRIYRRHGRKVIPALLPGLNGG
jgi:predicted nucleic acid-binding protein